MKRGEIWCASMDTPRGSEPGYRRPVVIISENEFNQSRIQTVVVATITSNLRLVEAPGNFKLSKSTSHLDKESVVNISQLVTLDKTYLTEKIGKLNAQQLNLLNDSLKLVLSII